MIWCFKASSSLLSNDPDRFLSYRPIQTLLHHRFPRDFRNATSSVEKVDMEMDLIRCGGVMPLLQKNSSNWCGYFEITLIWRFFFTFCAVAFWTFLFDSLDFCVIANTFAGDGTTIEMRLKTERKLLILLVFVWSDTKEEYECSSVLKYNLSTTF